MQCSLVNKVKIFCFNSPKMVKNKNSPHILKMLAPEKKTRAGYKNLPRIFYESVKPGNY